MNYQVARRCGSQPDRKVVVDISNPLDAETLHIAVQEGLGTGHGTAVKIVG